MLINKQESAGLKNLNYSKAFIEYSNDMDDIYKNIEEYDPNKECKILIIFDDMVTDVLSNKKLHARETELFVGGRKLTFSLVSLHSLTLLYQEIQIRKFQIKEQDKLKH